MGDAAAYAYVAMQNAINDAGLTTAEISNPRTGLIAGSGGASSANLVRGADTLRERGLRRVSPYLVPRTMSSTVSACLATHFGIQGLNYSITSACATSTHCIGAALEQIQWSKQDLIFAGGGEEEDWSLAMMFDAMGALSTKYNDQPSMASRAYDSERDGFVIAAGGGMLVLEELEHARARGAKIYAEVVGYGATSDGANMVAPSGEGAVRCMRQAIATVEAPIDYINTHGTSTPAVILPNWRRCARCSKTRFRPSVQASPCVDIRSVRQASRRQFTACSCWKTTSWQARPILSSWPPRRKACRSCGKVKTTPACTPS